MKLNELKKYNIIIVNMKSFKIKLPDYSETEVEVNSKYTVQ